MRKHLRWFFADLFGAYVDGVRVMRGLPWLFGAIVLWEFGQHVMEWRIGFFDSRQAAQAVAQDGSRMLLGWVKMILVYVGGFFTIRYLVMGGAARVMRPSSGTILAYLPYVLYALTEFALIFYAGAIVPTPRVMTLRGFVGIGQLLVEPLLMLWIVSAATDGPVRTPWQSARRMGGMYIYAFPVFFIGRIPVGAAHQVLGTWPIGRASALLWPMLALDAIVVGLLIAVVPALYVRCVQRIRLRPAVAPADGVGPR